jgi:hypothetical protein
VSRFLATAVAQFEVLAINLPTPEEHVELASWSRGIVVTTRPGIAISPAVAVGSSAVHAIQSQFAHSESVLVAVGEHPTTLALHESEKLRTSARLAMTLELSNG